MHFASPLSHIKGVGEKTAEQLAAAGLKTVDDLVHFLPRRYDDFSEVTPIANLHPGKRTIRARCENISTRPVRRGLRLTTATLADDSGKVQAVWFNQPYRESQLKTGDEFLFAGEFEFNYNKYQLTNPSAEKVEAAVSADRIVPQYPGIKGLKSQLVRKLLTEVRPLMRLYPETLPPEIIQSEGILSHTEAIEKLHFPESMDDVAKARDRIGFEEVFALLLASQLNKQENAKLEGWQIPFDVEVVKQFVTQLPFALTGAQRRAAWDIVQDFEHETPMNRLLQGDVGSGKTVVAGLAARQAAHAGFQTAIMAPTEILASQHAETLANLIEPFGITVGLLTGSVKGAARKALYQAIESGSVAVVVGTHALFQDAVTFHKLGFVVIDEQHRFGVAQRQALLAKSTRLPHLLAMTATPIPRSLALTLYGELDLSVLNERPQGRKPIATKIWAPTNLPKLYETIDKELEAGRQAYIICSLIDDSAQNDRKSVVAEQRRLQSTVFRHRRIGLLHGKLSPEEKDAVMQQFKDKEYDILVSTTVVEVGVDVPNATVIMIENADHFGLSQLHQLRGRVGRSSLQSYCYLIMSDSSKPSQRLREIEKSNDGFYLAEVDLRLRGPGEIYGRSQHGELNLQVATLADVKLINRAQRAARQFVQSGNDLVQYKQLCQQVQHYQRLTTLN